MKKKIEVIVDKKSYPTVDKLLISNPRLKKAFDKAVEKLKYKAEAGQRVPKPQWPKKIIKEFHPTNLFRMDLIRKHPGWRMVYTITPEGKVKILVVILKVVDHKEYDRLFRY